GPLAAVACAAAAAGPRAAGVGEDVRVGGRQFPGPPRRADVRGHREPVAPARPSLTGPGSPGANDRQLFPDRFSNWRIASTVARPTSAGCAPGATWLWMTYVFPPAARP